MTYHYHCQGVFALRDLDKANVDRLYTAFTTGAKTPEMRRKFESQGLDVVAGSPEDFMVLIREESARWAKVVKASGAKVE